MKNLDQPFREVLNAYQAAVFAKDVGALAALYDPDVLVFDAWGPWSYSGIESWQKTAEGWLGSLGTERVVVEFCNVQTEVAEDLAVVHAFVTYKAVTADGVELRSLDNRLTLVIKQKAGVWMIVHEHTSAPVDFGTLRAILTR